jgi:serine/threonine protein kinase
MKKFIERQQALKRAGKLPARGPYRHRGPRKRKSKQKKKSLFKVSDFKLDQQIHTTIYGAAYKEHIREKDWVVKVSNLKKIRRELILEDECPEDPFQECKLMRKIHPHQNLLLLTDELKDQKNHYVVFEYMPGGDLMDRIDKIGYLKPKIARKYIRQILLGLQHLHKQCIAHLDLSPENILIGENDVIKICDFGMAREMKRRLTSFYPFNAPEEEDDMPGKEGIRAPEIQQKGAYFGHQCDVYSAGVIFLLMLTGYYVYEEPVQTDEGFKTLYKEGLEARLKEMYIDCYLSKKALDFLSHMVCKVDDRWSIEQLLEHPWLHLPRRKKRANKR